MDNKTVLTRDDIERIAMSVYVKERFTKDDEVWHNLHWLTAFARAVETDLGARIQPAASEADQIERALYELVDKIVPGLDSGDLVADAKEASRHLDQRAPSEAGAVPVAWRDAAEMAKKFIANFFIIDYPATARAHIEGLADLILAAPPSAPAAEPSFQALLALFYAAGNVVPTKSEAHKFIAEDGVESSVSHIINLKCRAEDWKGFLDAYATALSAPAAQPEKQAAQDGSMAAEGRMLFKRWPGGLDEIDAAIESRDYRIKQGRWPTEAAPPAPSQQAAPAAESAESDELQESAEDAWRRLALQFDNHRMQAVAWLKKLAAGMPDSPERARVRAFLAMAPLDGEAVLAERIAALAVQPTAATADAQGDIAASVSDKSGCLSHSAGSDKQADAQGDERAAFVAAAAEHWKNSSPPDNAWIGFQLGAAWARQPSAAATAERACGNCEWTGKEGDCVMCGSVGPLCPECRETTEQVDAKASSVSLTDEQIRHKDEVYRAKFERWAGIRGYNITRTVDSYKSSGAASAFRGFGAGYQCALKDMSAALAAAKKGDE